MKDILLQIEAIIFASEEGISANDIRQVLHDALAVEVTNQEVIQLTKRIFDKYNGDDQVFSLKVIGKHYQFLTKEIYHETINQLQAHKDKKKLSQSALETLSIIAYRQPITKLEVEQIRGVNCDYSIQRLLEKKLIQITGKAETIGKPLLYATSDQFMNHFGIKSTKDLPQLKDIVAEENTIGEIAE